MKFVRRINAVSSVDTIPLTGDFIRLFHAQSKNESPFWFNSICSGREGSRPRSCIEDSAKKTGSISVRKKCSDHDGKA